VGLAAGGDAAILRFLAAAEPIEAGLWQQSTDLEELPPGIRIPIGLRYSNSIPTVLNIFPAIR
jgi:hypothetical protein